MEELSREDVRALAGEVLEDLGVEPVTITDEDREVIQRAAEEWKRRKAQENGEGI